MANAAIHITVHGGHWATGADLRARLEPRLRPAVARASLRVQAGVQQTTPVRSGALRRSWTTPPPAWAGTVLQSAVGTNLPYARYQNERTRNRGYIETGVDRVRAAAVGDLTAGLRAAAGAAWEPQP